MRLLALALIVFLSTPLQVFARSAASLGDLTVATTRVPDWYDVPEPDTTGWTEIDVTNQTEVDSVYSGNGDCTAIATGTSAPSARQSRLQCMADNNPGGGLILKFPTATYGFGNNGIARISNSNIEIKGDGAGLTIFQTDDEGMFEANDKTICRMSHFFVAGPTTEAVTQTWISGFTKGTTVVGVADASGFSVGDWAVMHHDGTVAAGLVSPSACPAGCAPTGHDHRELEEIAKVTAVDTGTDLITIDRPLRLDYNTWGTNPLIYKYVPLEEVGLSDLTIDFSETATDAPDSGIVCMSGVVNGWVRNVEFDTYWSKVINLISRSARNYIVGNQAYDAICPTCGGGSGYTFELQYASDNLLHNNICGSTSATEGNDRSSCIIVYLGAKGNMITYNYSDNCDENLPTGNGKRHIFFHGNFPFENLMEGNVAGTGCRIDYDNFYEFQGPRNTFFRNRFMDHNLTGKPSGIRAQKDDKPTIIAYDPNFILNFSPAYYTSAFQCGSADYAEGTCPALDYHDGMTEPHNFKTEAGVDGGGVFEYNIGTDTRSAADCISDNNPYNCCNAGPIERPNGCNFGFALHPDNVSLIDNNNLDRNSATAAIDGPWSSASLPQSLVNLDADGSSGGWNGADLRPPGWCAEITEWPIVGADVDVMPTSNTIKIPAQRRYDGDACTAWVSSATVTDPGLGITISDGIILQ